MKYFWIPTALLALLLGLSLWNANAAASAVEPWRAELAAAQEAARGGGRCARAGGRWSCGGATGGAGRGG